MKKYLIVFISVILLVSSAASCAPALEDSIAASSADGVEAYTEYLRSHLESMPDSLIIATEENSALYGVDMSEFSDDGYLTRSENGEVVIIGKTDAGLDRAVRDYVKNGNEHDYFAVYGEGYRVDRLTIAGNDISEYAVVTDDERDSCNAFAESELVKYIEKTCGARLPSYTYSEYERADNKPIRKIRITIDYPTLGDEAFRITVDGSGDLEIAGGRYRGCLYGVYDLLRDIGWRFVATLNSVDDGNNAIDYLYESEHVDITSAINRTEEGDIPVRGIGSGASGTANYNNQGLKQFNNYASRISGNAYMGFATRSCHGLEKNKKLIWGDKKFDSNTQPCFTDYDNIERIEEYALEYVQSRLDAGQVIGKDLIAVDVAQFDTDYNGFCYCRKCKEVESEEGSPSGAMVRLANHMARLLDKEYPGMYVSILAYCGTDILPRKTVPEDNVLVAYCFYYGRGYFSCSNHCISGKDCDPSSEVSNRLAAKRFEEWAEAIDPANFQIWYYPFNFYGVAFHSPFLNMIREDMAYLASFGTGHVYLCSSAGNGLNNNELARYIFSNVAWDTSMTEEDVEALILEWCNIVYGDAGENIFKYIMMCECAGDMAGCWCSFHSNSDKKVNNEYIAENFDTMYKLFDEARRLADTSYQEELVERYMGGMLYICLGITFEERYTNGSEQQRAVIRARYEEMDRIFRQYNLERFTNKYVPEVTDFEVNPFVAWNGGKRY